MIALLIINLGSVMNNEGTVSLTDISAASNKEIIVSYIRAAKEIKSKGQEEISCLAQVLKERNAEIKHLKTEAIKTKLHIDKHNLEFTKFRSILTDLKSKAEDGSLTDDVVYAPEIMSLKKEKDKYEALYQQEFDNSKKYESRSLAMSAQIIERQKKIYKLESLLLESEYQRQLLEAKIVLTENKQVSNVTPTNIDTMAKKLRECLQAFQRFVQPS